MRFQSGNRRGRNARRHRLPHRWSGSVCGTARARLGYRSAAHEAQTGCGRHCHPWGITAPCAAGRSCRACVASGYWIWYSNKLSCSLCGRCGQERLCYEWLGMANGASLSEVQIRRCFDRQSIDTLLLDLHLESRCFGRCRRKQINLENTDRIFAIFGQCECGRHRLGSDQARLIHHFVIV